MHAPMSRICPQKNPAALGGGEFRLFRATQLVLSLTCVAALQFGTGIHAQSLDDEIVRLLDNNCTVLAADSGTPNPDDFGPNLRAICAIPATSNGASSGGGGASVQGSVISIQNSALLMRLERARSVGRDEEEGDETARLLRSEGNLLNLMAAEGAEGFDQVDGRRIDFFASGSYGSLNRDLTPFEDGYDSSVIQATVGADYRVTNRLVAGVLASYRSQDGDFDGMGDFDMTAFEPVVFVSYLPTDRTFLQVVAGWSGQDFDTNRGVEFTIDRDGGGGTTELSGIASSGTDASQLNLGAQFGYDYSIRHFTFGPRIGANYSDTDIDGFVETGGTGLELIVADRSVDSFQGVLGFYGTGAYSRKSGVLLPYVNVEYVHEFEDSPSILTAQFVEDLRGAGATSFNYQTNVPSSDFFNLDVGLTAGFARGIWPYVSIRKMIGNDHFDSLVATIGVRIDR